MITLRYDGSQPERGFRVIVSRRPPFSFTAIVMVDGKAKRLERQIRTFPDLETALQAWSTYLAWVKDTLPDNLDLAAYKRTVLIPEQGEAPQYSDIILEITKSSAEEARAEIETLIELTHLNDAQNREMFDMIRQIPELSNTRRRADANATI